MLMCRHCGWENPDEAAFCTNCGRGLARGRGAEVTDRPSQRFRALGSPVVKVVSDPPAPAAPVVSRPAANVNPAPTLLDFRMPEQMLAELARVREARARASSAPPPAAEPEAAIERVELETLEPEVIESDPPEPVRQVTVPDVRALPATLQDMPTLRAEEGESLSQRSSRLGDFARALRAEAGSPPPARVEAPAEIEALISTDAAPAGLPLLPILADDEDLEDEPPPADPREDSTETSRETVDVDERPTMRLGEVAELAALLAPEPSVDVQARTTQEDLPFTLPTDDSADFEPDLLDDSLGGVEPDAFTGTIETSETDSTPPPDGEDLLEDVEDFIEEVDEGQDVLVSDEFEAVNILSRAAPPPLPAHTVRFLLRPLSENLDPGLLVPIATEPVLIGRSEGDLQLRDEFVSPRHARLLAEGDDLFVEDLGSLNGVWFRVRGDAHLKAGARFLAGQHVFKLEELPTNGASQPQGDGTRRLGAEPRHTAFQVVVQSGDGAVTHLHRLAPEGCRVGRHVADLVFTDDTFMSGTHALLRPRDDLVLLRDLASRNGTWLRIEGRTRLEPGDAVMIGHSVLRVGKPAN